MLEREFDMSDAQFRPRGGSERELTLGELWDYGLQTLWKTLAFLAAPICICRERRRPGNSSKRS